MEEDRLCGYNRWPGLAKVAKEIFLNSPENCMEIHGYRLDFCSQRSQFCTNMKTEKKISIRTERDHIIVQKKGFDVLKQCLFAAAFLIFSWTIFELRIIHETICAGQDFSIVDRRMILDFVRKGEGQRSNKNVSMAG